METVIIIIVVVLCAIALMAIIGSAMSAVSESDQRLQGATPPAAIPEPETPHVRKPHVLVAMTDAEIRDVWVRAYTQHFNGIYSMLDESVNTHVLGNILFSGHLLIRLNPATVYHNDALMEYGTNILCDAVRELTKAAAPGHARVHLLALTLAFTRLEKGAIGDAIGRMAALTMAVVLAAIDLGFTDKGVDQILTVLEARSISHETWSLLDAGLKP